MSEIKPPEEIAETIINENEFINNLFGPTEQDKNPPVSGVISEPKPETTERTEAKDKDNIIIDDEDVSDDIKVYVEGGIELTDAVKDIACEWISGQSDKMFNVNPKHLARLKRQTNKIASIYLKNPNPMSTWWLLVGLCFILPVSQAIAFRFFKNRERKQELEKIPENKIKDIELLINEKKPGRPSKEEIELKEAYERYKRKK